MYVYIYVYIYYIILYIYIKPTCIGKICHYFSLHHLSKTSGHLGNIKLRMVLTLLVIYNLKRLFKQTDLNCF